MIGFGNFNLKLREDEFNAAAHAAMVIDYLAEDGIEATYEFPGVVQIVADKRTLWNTGMHAWDYASVIVYEAPAEGEPLQGNASPLSGCDCDPCKEARAKDGMWVPDEDADIHVGLPEDRLDLDPQLIASRWAERVFRWRTGFVGAPK